MLKRKIYTDMLDWKNSNHKSLVITGQRQVGKTYIIDIFGRTEYAAYIKIDLSGDPESKKNIFGRLHGRRHNR